MHFYFCFRLLTLLVLLLYGPLIAEDVPQQKTVEELLHEPVPDAPRGEHFMESFFNMLFMLGILLLGMLIVAWLAKRFLNTRLEQANVTSVIKIIERRYLGPRSSIYLLDIMGQRIVIGETPAGISKLAEFSQKAPPPSFAEFLEPLTEKETSL